MLARTDWKFFRRTTPRLSFSSCVCRFVCVSIYFNLFSHTNDNVFVYTAMFALFFALEFIISCNSIHLTQCLMAFRKYHTHLESKMRLYLFVTKLFHSSCLIWNRLNLLFDVCVHCVCLPQQIFMSCLLVCAHQFSGLNSN